MNELTVQVYDRTGTRIQTPELAHGRAQNLRFATGYPAGLFLTASVDVPRNVAQRWQVEGAQKLVVRNGLKMVWEGEIVNLQGALGSTAGEMSILANGYWGTLMDARRIRKPWADTRMDSRTWVYDETASAAEKCSPDWYNRLMFVPKNEQWGAGEYAQFVYTAPTGETVKKISFGYDLAENSPTTEWKLTLERSTDGTSWTTDTTIASSTVTSGTVILLGTATQYVALRFTNDSGAAQTPPGDGTEFGKLTSVVVYTETSSINLTEIVTDVVGMLSGEMSADTDLIDSNTLALLPFVVDRYDTLAQVVTTAASFGDSSGNAWAVGVRESDLASDGLPIVFAEQQPPLTDYDYTVRLSDANVLPGLRWSRDVDDLHNWVAVAYRNDGGGTAYLTPNDDASLKDTDSIATYGQRAVVLNLPTGDSTTALAFGQRYLAAHKDAQYHMSAPVLVQGYVTAKGGRRIPASEIRAGKRLRIVDFLSDLSGTGLTFLISKTDYRDADNVCAMSAGVPDDLAVLLAQIKQGNSQI